MSHVPRIEDKWIAPWPTVDLVDEFRARFDAIELAGVGVAYDENGWPFAFSEPAESAADLLNANPGELEKRRALSPVEISRVVFSGMPKGLQTKAAEQVSTGGDQLPPRPRAPGIQSRTTVMLAYVAELSHERTEVIITRGNGVRSSIEPVRSE